MYHQECKFLSLYLILQISSNYRTLQTFKGKKTGAKKGYDLLKRKADALKKAFNDLSKVIVQVKKRMGKEY